MKQSLNYSWKFVDNFDPSYLKEGVHNYEYVDIPHTMKEVPYNYFSEESYQFIATYEKDFDIDENIQNKVVILRFEAFMLKAKIYLNNELLGYYHSGYIPVSIDITKYVRQTNNRLIVILDSKEDKENPPFGFAVDYLTFSGIYREVSLEVHPKTYIKDIYVHGDMDGNIVSSFTKIGEGSSFDYSQEVLDKDGKSVLSFKNEGHLDNPILWSIGNPYLYTLKTTIKSDDGKETYLTRFGFRTISWKKDGFYLNNEHIKLRGLNRHQSYPYMGYAASKALQEDDANILKYTLGVNVVRTSHYPNSVHFLNRCDEIGLLLINEIPGWQHIGESKKWKDNYYEFVTSMVIEERNHPCLIAHGVRIDESMDNHDMYLKGNEIAHELDPFGFTIGVRNFPDSELLEDIYGYNDFSSWKVGSTPLENPDKIKGKKDKPYLITEYLGHMDPTKPTSDQGQKTEHCLRHLEVINEALRYDRIAGAIGWCFVDYHTHVDFGSGDHICPHGVMDLYRNPKPAFLAYASQQDDFPVLDVITNMKPGDFPGAKFENIYVITNCDYIELYKNDEFVAKFYPNTQDKFKYLKHPPIYIDDIVGETFHEDKFPKKYAKKITKLLSFAAVNGYGALSLKQKLDLATMIKKFNVSYDELVGYFQKYVGSWGGIAKYYRFVGYKDGKEVKVCKLGPSKHFKLDIKATKLVLENKETYDSTRISIRYLDINDSLMQYANKVVHIEASGPIKVYGDEYQALVGGQLSLFVNSLNKKGMAKIKITLEDLVKEVDIEVK